jgi:hypothetical protein
MFPSKTPKRASRKNPFPVSLNHRLDHKLLGYAAAASAAGVGMMALAQPAQAEIVYTLANQKVGGSLAIDLNHDGITDFTLGNLVSYNCAGPNCVLQEVTVSPNSPNRVWVTSGGGFFARALSIGQRVGPGDNFGSGYVQMDRCKSTRTSFYAYGSWFNTRNGYLALAFSIDGRTHYGWARVSLIEAKRPCRQTVVLISYAYETEPDRPILTGKTSGTDEADAADRPQATLGALALGSAGLVAWRRDEEEDGTGT